MGLRTKFLLALTAITALLTFGVLGIVQYRVRIHVRGEITQALGDAVVTFRNLQAQREETLGRSAALLATLPPLKAVMTSADPATIQDASEMFWRLSGSQVFVLADPSGKLLAFHSSSGGFTAADAQAALERTLKASEPRDWWFGGSHLLEVFVEPIAVGDPRAGNWLGYLALGYEIDAKVAADVTRVASCDVGFGYDKRLITSTVASKQYADLAAHVAGLGGSRVQSTETELGGERFLTTSVQLSATSTPLVTLTFVKSYDQATAFLRSLNRWIAAIGVAGVVAGSLLVFFVSTTFTRPLGRLVSGVRALERGDFAFPLDRKGGDEVATLTTAFENMRGSLQAAQHQLLEAEQLATIGRMASTISHDLRHPLTAILAYAEFLSERDLTDEQRKDYFEEIRIGVNRMMDEINSLLGFSKEGARLELACDRVDTVIERAIRMVKALPDFERISISLAPGDACVGWFDASRLERVLLNLLFNAAEAVDPESGRIVISCRAAPAGTEIRVSDNGPGIPNEIRETLFRPFVSHGKQQGIGLGLTVVQSIMRQHNGEVAIEHTGADGTIFRLFFPAQAAAATPASGTSLA
jgi:signal transduction histidine kinase